MARIVYHQIHVEIRVSETVAAATLALTVEVIAALLNLFI
jgi:hypothetical protein